MSETDNANGPKMETTVVVQTEKKSLGYIIAKSIGGVIGSLLFAVAVGFILLNFTDKGEELKAKYERQCDSTKYDLDSGIEFCRWYIAQFGRAPSSAREVKEYQDARLRESLNRSLNRKMVVAGQTLRAPLSFGPGPLWNGTDGFGHDVKIEVDTSARKIKLTSPGLIPVSGDIPGFLDYVREGDY